MTDELKKATAFALQEGEELLWAQHRHKRVDQNCALCATIGLFFLITGTIYLLNMDEYEGATSENLFCLGVIMLAAMIGLVTAAVTYRYNPRIIYALTNRRALVFQPGILASPIVFAIPISTKLVHRVTRRSDGSADYLMYNVEIGNHANEDGFRYVREPEKLEAVLAQLGIPLPEGALKLPTAYRIQYVSPAALAIVGWLVGALLMLGVLLPITAWNEGANLYLWGESAEAVIIGHEKHSRREGRHNKSTGTSYTPIISYRNAEGQLCRGKESSNYSEPDWQTGEKVTIFYNPAEPERIIRKNADMLLFPGTMLLIGLWMLWRGCKSAQRLRNTRHESYRIFTAEEI